MAIGLEDGTVAAYRSADGKPVHVAIDNSLRDGFGRVVWSGSGEFTIGDVAYMHGDGLVYSHPTSPPERDYWLLSEATYRYRDKATESVVYVFPGGMRHGVADHMLVACKGDLSDIRVPKLKPTATGTLKSSWQPYTTTTGTATGNVIFKTGGTYATASEMRSMDEMRVIAGTQTPRQWLDNRVSEIAEQGRL